MKRLTKGLLTSGLLLGPVLAQAGAREEKYTLLLVGGVGGILVGAGLYAILLVLAAIFLKHKALMVAAFGGCVVCFLRMEYLSFQTLRVALALAQTSQDNPGPAPLTVPLVLVLVGLAAYGLLVVRLALRLWQKRQRRLVPAPDGRTRGVHRWQ